MKLWNLALLGLNAALIMALAGTGCAKKQKPDLPVVGADNAANAIMDQDLKWDSLGSDSGKIQGLKSVHFEYDKSNLTEENRGILSGDADWLKKHSTKSLQIEGHCDRHGSIEYNLALGERRAKAVEKYLLDLGIEKDRLSTISYGKEHMIDSAETEAADTANRRANFKPVDSPKVHRMSQN